MAEHFIPLTLLLSTVFYILGFLQNARQRKNFTDLPDDVLLEVFMNLDFSSIISLRQVSRQCYAVSKNGAVWLDAFHWITGNGKNWRSAWLECLPSRSGNDVEKLVSRMVRFERNWTSQRPKVVRMARFKLPPGGTLTSAFIPGGRWFFRPSLDNDGCVFYYNCDDAVPSPRVFTSRCQPMQNVWAMTFPTDMLPGSSEFELAIEFGPADKDSHMSEIPRDLTIWKAVSEPSGNLSSELLHSFTVFRSGLFAGGSLSMVGQSLLRSSDAPWTETVITVHRWTNPPNATIKHLIMLPQSPEELSEARLLPDGRIMVLYINRLELYASAEIPWEESRAIPTSTPRATPQWTFLFKPSPHGYRYGLSRPTYFIGQNSASFILHNHESVFKIVVLFDKLSEPTAKTILSARLPQRGSLGAGEDRLLQSTAGQTRSVLATIAQDSSIFALRSFAGVVQDESESIVLSGGGLQVRELVLRSPSALEPWELDEWSGRVLCALQTKRADIRQWWIMCFVD